MKKWNHEQCPLYIRLYIFLKSECNIRHPHSGASKWGLDIAGFQPIHTQSHLGFPLPTMKPTYWSHQTRLGTGNSSLKIFPTAVRYCGSCCARKLRVELSLGVPRPPQGGGKHRHQCWNKTNKWSWQWYGHRLWVSMLWSFTTMGKRNDHRVLPKWIAQRPFSMTTNPLVVQLDELSQLITACWRHPEGYSAVTRNFCPSNEAKARVFRRRVTDEHLGPWR